MSGEPERYSAVAPNARYAPRNTLSEDCEHVHGLVACLVQSFIEYWRSALVPFMPYCVIGTKRQEFIQAERNASQPQRGELARQQALGERQWQHDL